MDRASASLPGEREFDDAAKAALLAEYDASDYKGRYALLDREQISIRHISRWRIEQRRSGGGLRVERDPTPPRPHVVPSLPPAVRAVDEIDRPAPTLAADPPTDTPRGLSGHVAEIRAHVHAIEQLLTNRSVSAADREMPDRLVRAVREVLAADQGTVTDPEPSSGDGTERRRPWWGATDSGNGSEPSAKRPPHRWGQSDTSH